MTSRESVAAVKDEVSGDLERISGVTGIGVGPKIVGGRETQRLSIQVFVERKRPRSEVPEGELIPPEIRGIPTDVIEAGPVELIQEPCDAFDGDFQHYRPLLGGCAIVSETHPPPNFGTLGCMARTTAAQPADVLLTNEHVIGSVVDAKVGQPDLIDVSACLSNIIGRVSAAVNNARADAAIARLDAGVSFRGEVLQIGEITGRYNLQPGDVPGFPVRKRGARTRLTRGRVIDDAFNDTDNGHVNQLRIEAVGGSVFVCRGDSGSVVVNRVNEVLGLIYGMQSVGDKRIGVATRIADVFAELPLDHLVTGDELRDPYIVPGPLASFESSQPGIFAAATLQRVLGVGADDLPRVRANPLAAFYLEHGAEVFSLVRSNRSVARVWLRGGGPALARLLLRVAQEPTREHLEHVARICSPDRLDELSEVLLRYGSPQLRADLVRVHAALRDDPQDVYLDLVTRVRASHDDLRVAGAGRPFASNRR